MKLFEITLKIDTIIIGERFKGGTFRPCQDIIPSSTIEGALKHYFGLEVAAVGFFKEGTYEFDMFTYSVRDRHINISKLPITTMYLKPKRENKKIEAWIYIPYKNNTNLINKLKGTEFQIGALKSKGFGKSKIVKIKEISSEIKQGILKIKIFEDEANEMGIEPISPVYGYLFKPDKFSVGGIYKKALFPGSLVNAPKILLKKVTYYDE